MGSSSNKMSGQGVNSVQPPHSPGTGVLSAMLFDGIAAVRSLRFGGPVLVLGCDLPALFNIVKSPSRAERVHVQYGWCGMGARQVGIRGQMLVSARTILWQRRSPTA